MVTSVVVVRLSKSTGVMMEDILKLMDDHLARYLEGPRKGLLSAIIEVYLLVHPCHGWQASLTRNCGKDSLGGIVRGRPVVRFPRRYRLVEGTEMVLRAVLDLRQVVDP
jgi:hypothetical protein